MQRIGDMNFGVAPKSPSSKTRRTRLTRIRRVRERLEYKNPWFRLYFDDVIFPDLSRGRYTRVLEGETGIAVMVLPINDRSEIGLINIFRYATETWEWEIPRGLAEPGSSATENARRELREETGLDSRRLLPLGTIYPNTGILTTRVKAYVAYRLHRVKNDLPKQEAIAEFKFVSSKNFLRMMNEGKIRDAMTLSCVSLAMAKNLFPVP